MPPQHWRHLWLNVPPARRLHLLVANHSERSYIVITAAEADLTAQSPGRFIGEARPIVAGSIAPQAGYVWFTLWWYGDFPYLSIWTDITVFDPSDPSGTN